MFFLKCQMQGHHQSGCSYLSSGSCPLALSSAHLHSLESWQHQPHPTSNTSYKDQNEGPQSAVKHLQNLLCSSTFIRALATPHTTPYPINCPSVLHPSILKIEISASRSYIKHKISLKIPTIVFLSHE